MLKKQDIKLIMGVLVAALILLAIAGLLTRNQGQQLVIFIDGTLYGSYSLAENRIIEVENERGYNRLVIHDGRVWMEEADCPDQYCVEHRAISNQNETIVCLPHKLVAQTITDTEAQVDAVTQLEPNRLLVPTACFHGVSVKNRFFTRQICADAQIRGLLAE